MTKQGVPFEWTAEHTKAFDHLKRELSKPTVLGYYDVKDRTRVIADASPVGLGAILMQFDTHGPRIISFASRALKDVEKRYAQTEKEALALVWAVERFQQFLLGKEFELVSDCKPLETIFGPRSKPCARIERWVMRLMAFKYRIIHKPGKTNIADCLSRLSISDDATIDDSLSQRSTEYVNWIVENSTPRAVKISEIEVESSTDEGILAVRKGIYENEWSEAAMPILFQRQYFVTWYTHRDTSDTA